MHPSSNSKYSGSFFRNVEKLHFRGSYIDCCRFCRFQCPGPEQQTNKQAARQGKAKQSRIDQSINQSISQSVHPSIHPSSQQASKQAKKQTHKPSGLPKTSASFHLQGTLQVSSGCGEIGLQQIEGSRMAPRRRKISSAGRGGLGASPVGFF